MIPKPGSAVRMLAQRLMSETVPNLASQYAMSDTAMVTMLLSALAAELDDGIERRLTDGREMFALLRAGHESGHIDSAPSGEEPASMTLADVNAWHDALTRQLIDLHEQVEAAGDRDLDAAIWRYLGDSASRHALPL